MKRVCSWCQREFGTKEGNGQPDDAITSMICQDCWNEMFPDGHSTASFLNRLDAPVAVVNDRGRLLGANRAGEALSEARGLETPVGETIGRVFDCAHYAGGDCGRTIHCSACAIRDAVMRTHQTKVGVHQVPAVLKRQADDAVEPGRVDLLVSTEYHRGLVCLQIEELTQCGIVEEPESGEKVEETRNIG